MKLLQVVLLCGLLAVTAVHCKEDYEDENGGDYPVSGGDDDDPDTEPSEEDPEEPSDYNPDDYEEPHKTTKRPRTTTRRPRTTTKRPRTTTRRPKTTTRRPKTTKRPRTTPRPTGTPKPDPKYCYKKINCDDQDARYVCGVTACGNTRTFRNDCERRKYNCKYDGCDYNWLHYGKCEDDEDHGTGDCDTCEGQEYAPVCAKNSRGDLQTFCNRCLLDRYNCLNDFKNTFKFYRNGPCNPDKTDHSCGKKSCSLKKNLVCGKNAKGECKTFRNQCFLDRYNCFRRNIKGFYKFLKYSNGKCTRKCGKPYSSDETGGDDECTDYRRCTCNTRCTYDYNPVCGCRLNSKDEVECKTFSNECLLKKYNCQNPTKRFECVSKCQCESFCAKKYEDTKLDLEDYDGAEPVAEQAEPDEAAE